MLTPKQERFVQNIVKGMSQIDAYKDAYNAERMSDNAISREACLLLQNPKIAQRHKELGAMTENKTIMSAQDRLEWLTKIIRSDEETTADKLKASDQMNKMQGEYIQKVVADVDTTYSINIDLVDDDE